MSSTVSTLSIVPAGQILPGTKPAVIPDAWFKFGLRLKLRVQFFGAAFAHSIMIWYKYTEFFVSVLLRSHVVPCLIRDWRDVAFQSQAGTACSQAQGGYGSWY